jgi:hypothetical protein
MNGDFVNNLRRLLENLLVHPGTGRPILEDRFGKDTVAAAFEEKLVWADFWGRTNLEPAGRAKLNSFTPEPRASKPLVRPAAANVTAAPEPQVEPALPPAPRQSLLTTRQKEIDDMRNDDHAREIIRNYIRQHPMVSAGQIANFCEHGLPVSTVYKLLQRWSSDPASGIVRSGAGKANAPYQFSNCDTHAAAHGVGAPKAARVVTRKSAAPKRPQPANPEPEVEAQPSLELNPIQPHQQPPRASAPKPDPELGAIQTCHERLAGLERQQIARILEYLWSRHVSQASPAWMGMA